MTEDEFEWDDAKAASNLAKHKVSFEIARLVFDDAFALIEIDASVDYGEERCIVRGIIQGRLYSRPTFERCLYGTNGPHSFDIGAQSHPA
jgi:uncharacterized DUF497 family protein